MQRYYALFAAFFFCLSACSDDTPADSGCVEGATQACACTDGSMGAQTCNQAGTFDSCVCASANVDTDGGTNVITDGGDTFVNPCGGRTQLDDLPGTSCGPCDDGFFVCDGSEATTCFAASELNACDACGRLPGVPGEVCGCGDDVWACQTDGTLECLSAPANSCGGCVPLGAEYRDECDNGAGFLSCSSEDELICVPVGANACGGTSQLAGVPGAACGECLLGKWICDGAESVVCNDQGVTRNECGGCGQLDARRGDSCGTCGGEVVCDGSEATRCDTQANACGGCGPLSDLPGSTCPGGLNVCDGSGGVACSATATNACGGTGQLSETPGDPCGTCGNGVVVCVARDSVACAGDSLVNPCGGCAALPLLVGASCGPEQVVACDPNDADRVVCTDASQVNACGGTMSLPAVVGEECGDPGQCREFVCDGPNSTVCSPADTDPDDRFNCGTCGRDCPVGETCSSGMCEPIQSGTGKWVDVEVGNAHGCALTDGGDVFCWGDDSKGQLAVPGAFPRAVPQKITAISNVRDIAVSDDFSCAVLNTGDVACWGTTTVPDLFDGTSTYWESPTVVSNVNTGIVEIDAGWETICALSSANELQCWGSNEHLSVNGKLGNGSAATSAPAGTDVPLSGTITSFSVGAGHACAVSNQTIYCWGRDFDGQLGDGGAVGHQLAPVAVNLGSSPSKVAAGFAHTCAIASGQLFCWGSNNNSAVGSQSSGPQYSPVPLSVPNSPAVVELGHQTTHVGRAAGVDGIFPFGWNRDYRLGNGRSSSDYRPALEVLDSVTIVDISVDETWGCALDDVGNVYCWGTPPNGLPVLLDGQIQPAEHKVVATRSPYIEAPAEVCGDGLDNDSDGLADCESSDCLSGSSTSGTDFFGGASPPEFDETHGNHYENPFTWCVEDFSVSRGGIDQVFKWTAPTTGDYQLTGISSGLFSYIYSVIDSCDRTANTTLACYSEAVDQSGMGSGVPSDFNVFSAVQGQEYFIVVDLAQGAFSPFSMYPYDDYSFSIAPFP